MFNPKLQFSTATFDILLQADDTVHVTMKEDDLTDGSVSFYGVRYRNIRTWYHKKDGRWQLLLTQSGDPQIYASPSFSKVAREKFIKRLELEVLDWLVNHSMELNEARKYYAIERICSKAGKINELQLEIKKFMDEIDLEFKNWYGEDCKVIYEGVRSKLFEDYSLPMGVIDRC